MADPTSIALMAGGSMALKASGAILGSLGAVESGAAASKMYDYQAGVALVNKQIAEQNANYAVYSGEIEAQQTGMKARAQIGMTKAEQGASGLDVASGSAARVRASEKDIADENIAIIRSDAAKRAYGYQVEAMQQGAQAEIDRVASKQSRIAGTFGAISSLLGGAASVGSDWTKAVQTGIFGSKPETAGMGMNLSNASGLY